MVNLTCGAPWCNRPSEKAKGKTPRRINGIELCHACYVFIWEQARKLEKPLAEIFPNNIKDIRPPLTPITIPEGGTICQRKNCNEIIPAHTDPRKRRRIGKLIVCRNCYQTAWEVAKKENITLEAALNKLKPKGWHLEQPQMVKCSMLWCGNYILPKKNRRLSEEHYVCGRCSAYLTVLSKRAMYNGRTWQQIGLDVISGRDIPQPGMPEKCIMSWCNNREIIRRRTPSGEPLCNADFTYLRGYARTKNISFAEAIQTAPRPRLLHIRGLHKRADVE